ncbi:MAG: type I-E CRISPR-associated protein Cas6/Cse3/CasE, partial [Rhodocyclaceae bacterium]
MSHFFSRVRLDRQGLDRQELARVAAGDAYRDHALVWRLFPGDDAERCFVFRADRDRDGWPSFLVVSDREPEAVPGLLRLETPKPYAPRLTLGEQVQFDLRANPTEAVATPLSAGELSAYNARRTAAGKPPKERHHRRGFHDVIMAAKKRRSHPLPKDATEKQRRDMEDAADAAARQWFLKQAPQWGLEVLQRENLFTRDPEPALDWNAYTQHRLRRKEQELAFSSLDYQGLARVSDPDKLSSALTGGVGRAKAFG